MIQLSPQNPLIALALLASPLFGMQDQSTPPSELNQGEVSSNVTGKPSKEKFERALILGGGGLNFARQLGQLERLDEVGLSPDVIIGTCGGALAGVYATIFSDSAQRKEYLQSREFFESMRAVQVSKTYEGKPGVWKLFGLLGSIEVHISKRSLPDFTSTYVLQVDALTNDERLKRPFDPEGIRLVIVGAKFDFDTPFSEMVGKGLGGTKPVKEVLFSDPETLARLENFVSPIAKDFPESYVATLAHLDATRTIGEAARVSITDPYLMRPLELDAQLHIGGAVDLYPIEVGRTIAKSVIAFYGTLFDPGFLTIVKSAFGFDQNERLKNYVGQEAAYWIDTKIPPTMDMNFEFSDEAIKKSGFVVRVPADYEKFKEIIDLQWELGRKQVDDAVTSQKDAKAKQGQTDR